MEVIEREIKTERIAEAARTDWETIRKELRELIRSYEIPEKYEEEILKEIRERIRKKIKNEQLADILTKVYIRIAYELLIIKEDEKCSQQ